VPEFPYRHPIYERLLWTAQDLNQPLCCTFRRRVRSASERVHHGLDGDDSLRPLDDRLLGAVFDGGDAVRRCLDRYPRLRIGSVEGNEASWIPHWLKQMDFVYTEAPSFHQSVEVPGRLRCSSEYWRRNMFVDSWRMISGQIA